MLDTAIWIVQQVINGTCGIRQRRAGKLEVHGADAIEQVRVERLAQVVGAAGCAEFDELHLVEQGHRIEHLEAAFHGVGQAVAEWGGEVAFGE